VEVASPQGVPVVVVVVVVLAEARRAQHSVR